MNTDSKIYTVQDIRSILGIGKNKAYNLCTSGAFTYKKVGKSILIPKDSFTNWLNTTDHE